MTAGLALPITTKFTRRVTTIADVETLEQSPYEALIPARNLYQLFQSTAQLHPDRPALTVVTADVSGKDEVRLTHRELLGAITRAANLFRSLGVAPDRGTVAILCPILPPIPAALLGAQVAGTASSINYLLSEDAIVAMTRCGWGYLHRKIAVCTFIRQIRSWQVRRSLRAGHTGERCHRSGLRICFPRYGI